MASLIPKDGFTKQQDRPCYCPFFALLLLLLFLTSRPLWAEQRLDMEGAAIFGNKESPNILYVVPWRKPNSKLSMLPPRMGSIDELLAPLDRDVFRRRIDWHQTFAENP